MFEQRLDENEGVSHVGVRRRECHPERVVRWAWKYLRSWQLEQEE